MVVNLKDSNYINRTEMLAAYYNDIKYYDKFLEDYDEHETFVAIYMLKKKSNEIIEKFKEENGYNPSQSYVDTILKEKYNVSKGARERLISKVMCMNLRLVVSIAKTLGTTKDILDIITEGNIGMLQAIDEYNPFNENGAKFSTFAVHYIRRQINIYKVNSSNIVKKQNISKTYHIIPKARNMFLQEYNRAPTADELKEFVNDKFGVDIKEITDVLDLKVFSIDSFSENTDEDSYNSTVDVYNTYSSSKNIAEENCNIEYNSELVKAMLTYLPKRDKEVMSMHYGIGFDRPYEISEIAEKMGITRERVRQIKKDAIRKLKKKFSKSYVGD